MKRPSIAASILAADFADMGGAAALAERSGAGFLHLDVMDGRFVPNLTFGPKVVADLRPRCALPLDVHLMTIEPERLFEDFVEAGADYLTFHIEATVHAHRHCERIRQLGAKPGISLVPSTPLSALEEILPLVDLVLVMSVNPGFGGQALIPSCIDKLRRLARLRQEGGHSFLISVDGGINKETAGSAVAAGSDLLVMGSAFFGAEDPASIVSYVDGLA